MGASRKPIGFWLDRGSVTIDDYTLCRPQWPVPRSNGFDDTNFGVIGQDVLVKNIRIFTYSIASLSWIDPRTNLPEVDKFGNPGPMISRDTIFGKQAYRFANFLEASITVMDTSNGPMLSVAGPYGFTKESGMYRGLSYADIPSEPFSVKRTTETVESGVRFRQIVGARTQSPEILVERVAGPFGAIAREALEAGVFEFKEVIDIGSFPPIWTELELIIYFDGSCDGRVVRHSLFPSMSVYYSNQVVKFFVPEQMGSPAINIAPFDGFYRKGLDYDGIPNYAIWRQRGWGKLASKLSGPVGGNPWAIPNPVGLGTGRADVPGRLPGSPVTEPIVDE